MVDRGRYENYQSGGGIFKAASAEWGVVQSKEGRPLKILSETKSNSRPNPSRKLCE